MAPGPRFRTGSIQPRHRAVVFRGLSLRPRTELRPGVASRPGCRDRGSRVFIDELEITQYRLAKTIHVAPRRINEIVHGRRSITADTALRIARALGTTPEFWLNLQRRYDLETARDLVDVDAIDPLVTHTESRAAA